MATAAEIQAAETPEEDCSSKKNKVCIVHSKQLLELAEKNPRFAGRGRLVHSLIEAYGLLNKLRVLEPSLATKKELQAFHSSAYIHFLDTHNNHSSDDDDDLLLLGAESEEMEVFGLGYDCPLFAGVFHCVSATAGSSLTAASALVDGEASVVLNWYGGWHHGRKDEASGFCYCNDIVLAILRLQEKFQRVLYIDIDLHHGDGVEDAFYHSPRVMTVSLHKYCGPGFFPGTGDLESVGSGKGKYHCINVPLSDGIRDEQYEKIFKRVLSEAKLSFDPHAVVMQCGADMLSGDPVGSFCLTPEGVGKCVSFVLHWDIPTLLLGGGGYHFSNTARFWTYCTALAVREVPSYEIPDHDHFEQYGPGYELYFTAANRPNDNPQKKIDNILQTISQYLSNLQQLPAAAQE